MPALRQKTQEHWVFEPLRSRRHKYRNNCVYRVNGLHFGSEFRKSIYPAFSESEELAIPIPRKLRQPTTRRSPPLKLSDLECVRTLGAGGNGAVLLVRTRIKLSTSSRAGSFFAVKVWRKTSVRATENTNNWGAKDTERLFLGRLPWNSFVTGIIDAYQDERNLYVVMEYIPHATLRDQLEKTAPLPLTTTAFYFANIVCGLEFLENHKICHRDLKPENLLIDGNGYLVIADFGTAAKNDDTAETWSGVGTTIYMAPELFYATSPAPYGDWWSLGCILYEMTAGTVPYLGKSDESIRRRMTSGVIRYPETPRVGLTLKNLIKGLLTADPLNRIGRHGASQAMEHPWISHISWDTMRSRNYMAPPAPRHENPLQTWQKLPLPEQRQIPGLQIAPISDLLRFDERFPPKSMV